MRVLLIGFTKIAYMPYMHFYINQLQQANCKISLIYWDRDGKPDIEAPRGIQVYKFYDYMLDSEPIIKKIPRLMRYRKRAKCIIQNNEFDLLIVLHSTPGVLLYDVLINKYSGRFIFDYRDFTYENIGFYKKIIHDIVNNSIATFVSSDAYRKYLPNRENIFTSHNILLDSLKYRDIRFNQPRKNIPIRIRFWGFVRHEEINIKIINKIANDSRFELHYHGREQKAAKNIKQYCMKFGVNNVFFHGEFQPDDRYRFAKETELLHNIYEDTNTQSAMSNKFYDGIVFYIPQLCNKGSFMGNNVEQSEIGISLDLDNENFADIVYEYYNSIDWESFISNCDATLNQVLKEYYKGARIVQDIIGKEKDCTLNV